MYLGDSPRALTVDGTHQSEGAAELIGIPFSQALLEIVNAGEPGDPLELPIVPTGAFDGLTFCTLMNERHLMPDMASFDGIIVSASGAESPDGNDTLFRRARRRAPAGFVTSSGWGVREEKNNPGMHGRAESLIALERGATIRVPACSRFVCFLGFANRTALTVRVDGSSATVQPTRILSPTGQPLWVLAVADRLGEGAHVVELTANEPMVAVNDIYYIEPAL